jgi:hypothetical protein
MKKSVLLVLFAVCLMSAVYAQTWTVRQNDGGEWEYTVITKEQFQRLLRQYETSREACNVAYTDSLEFSGSGYVISGQKPKLNGYYYLIAKIKFPNSVMETAAQFSEMSPTLFYGHSQRGYTGFTFGNELFFQGGSSDVVPVNSGEFAKRKKLYFGFVEGR